jgi:hypothetical protein
MKRTLVLLTLLIGLGLMTAPAFAQETVALTCTGSTVCNPAGGAFATQSTGANPPTFTVSNTDGTKCGSGDSCQAYLAILVASSTLASGFTVNGVGIESGEPKTFNNASSSLWGALGENGGQDNTFTPWQTTAQANGAAITSSGSFSVYDFLLGTFTGPGSFSAAITLSGAVPVGTGFAAFYEDVTAGDAIVNNSKLSESLDTGTGVPEPASMGLLGTALLGAYGLLRRKLLG